MAERLDGTDWVVGRTFIRTMAAYHRDDAEAFHRGVAELERNRGGDPAVAVLKRLPVATTGERMPQLISAWVDAGRPDLSRNRLLVPVTRQRQTCRASERSPPPVPDLTTPRAFLRWYSKRPAGVTIPPKAIGAAIRHTRNPDEGVRLVALALLADSRLSPEDALAIRAVLLSGLEGLAAAHRDTTFFGLVAVTREVIQQDRVEPATLARLAELTRRDAFRLPHRTVLEAFRTAYGEEKDQEACFDATVGALTSLESSFGPASEKLLADGMPSSATDSVRALAQQMAASGWLVNTAIASSLLRKVARRTGAPADADAQATVYARFRKHFSGESTMFPRLGQWPISALAEEWIRFGLDDEFALADRYAALGAE